MSAYIIIRVDIRDREAYGRYMQYTPRVVDQYGGRFIVRGGETETLEGDEETLRMVVVEFPSMDMARGFYRSEEYQAVKGLRLGAGEAQFVAVDGYPTEEWNRTLEESETLET
jgi:uncharacterized protein (DUF1330 family)